MCDLGSNDLGVGPLTLLCVLCRGVVASELLQGCLRCQLVYDTVYAGAGREVLRSCRSVLRLHERVVDEPRARVVAPLWCAILTWGGGLVWAAAFRKRGVYAAHVVSGTWNDAQDYSHMGGSFRSGYWHEGAVLGWGGPAGVVWGC